MQRILKNETNERVRMTIQAKSQQEYIYRFLSSATEENLKELYDSAGQVKEDIKTAWLEIPKNDHGHIKDIVKEFFRRLRRFAEGKSYARNAMLELLYKYIDLYKSSPYYKSFIDVLHSAIESIPDKKYSHKLKMRGGTRKTVKTSEGETFVLDAPKKNWTRSKKYKNWVGKLTRRQAPNKKTEDLCVGKGSICKGDLGIPRKFMPQFNSPAEIKSFTKFVKKAYKIKSFKSKRAANVLKPSQGEINRKRIKGLIEDGVLEKVNVPLITSGDNYVVDGHHRWAAYRLEKPKAKLPVVVIDAPIKDVLGIAVAWGAKHQEF